jgi:hypothetical protein
MVSVPQFLSSGQSAGFTRSSSEICLHEPASGSSASSLSGSEATASITMAFPRAAMSSLIRLSSISEKRYSSRKLRLAKMNHH